ncbi:MAG: hypothetical protein ABGZ24_06420, partial [Fuerstiella sp.]
PYSRRDGTAAADFKDQVPGNVIKERVHALSELERDLALEFYRSRIESGAEQIVLVERTCDDRLGWVKGTDQWYIPTEVRGTDADRGTFVRCVAEEANRERVQASRVETPEQIASCMTAAQLAVSPQVRH